MQAISPDVTQMGEIARQAGTEGIRKLVELQAAGLPIDPAVAAQAKSESGKLYQFIMTRSGKDETTNQTTWETFKQLLGEKTAAEIQLKKIANKIYKTYLNK